jgi:hypothetical protein
MYLNLNQFADKVTSSETSNQINIIHHILTNGYI